MTNLKHIANFLNREAQRLYAKADYHAEHETATDEYIATIERMAVKLESAAECIDEYYALKATLSRRVLDVPPRGGRKPRSVSYEAYIAVRSGDDEEVVEEQ